MLFPQMHRLIPFPKAALLSVGPVPLETASVPFQRQMSCLSLPLDSSSFQAVLAWLQMDLLITLIYASWCGIGLLAILYPMIYFNVHVLHNEIAFTALVTWRKAREFLNSFTVHCDRSTSDGVFERLAISID